MGLDKRSGHIYEAIRIIHGHGQGDFHDRLFHALDGLFEGSRYALELFGDDGEYAIESNLPFHESRDSDILVRTGELVKQQSPMFQKLAEGESSPMRLSDLISMRQLQRTELYHEIFKTIHIRHQIGIPVRSTVVLGGLTLNRDVRDFRGDDLKLACILAPQIATAFEADLLFRKLKRATFKPAEMDHTQLRRLGLSRREAEILLWLSDGKRDREIAVILGISVRTVNHHVSVILRKLQVENRTAAVQMVLRHMPGVEGVLGARGRRR